MPEAARPSLHADTASERRGAGVWWVSFVPLDQPRLRTPPPCKLACTIQALSKDVRCPSFSGLLMPGQRALTLPLRCLALLGGGEGVGQSELK
jgi:hypothetical protein